MSEKHSAIALVQRSDGRLLVVWNRRYGGWSLPGGMVEADEDPPEACTRELREETGLFGLVTRELHVAPAWASTVVEGRATIVHVFEVAILGANSFAVPQPSEQEEGCPVSWFTREDFLRWSPFAPFYREMFATISELGTRAVAVPDGEGESASEPRRGACGIPARTLPPCDLEWGHDGDMHGNGGDGFYASQHLEEHRRRQAARKKSPR